MSTFAISTALQVIVALGLLNVWLVRAKASILLLLGIWVKSPDLVRLPALIVAGLMVGALAMHAKVKDPLTKSLPALAMLLMCVAIWFLH